MSSKLWHVVRTAYSIKVRWPAPGFGFYAVEVYRDGRVELPPSSMIKTLDGAEYLAKMVVKAATIARREFATTTAATIVAEDK